MTKNPFLNALAAAGYIVFVGLLMNYVSHTLRNTPDTFVAPIAVVSLFTLSAGLMGYFFLYQPLQLYLDGKKKQASSLFIQTLLTFAGITVVIFLLLLLRIIK